MSPMTCSGVITKITTRGSNCEISRNRHEAEQKQVRVQTG